MICVKCNHAADDHTFDIPYPSQDPRYCTVSGCECKGWERRLEEKTSLDFETAEVETPKGKWVRVHGSNGTNKIIWWPEETE
jgi:hypothetical protein